MIRLRRFNKEYILPVRSAINTTQGGFTLIELLLYTAIVSTLLIAITGFFAITAESRIKNQSISEVNQQGAAIMDVITQAVRNASSVTTPTPGATAGSLTLAMPASGINPTVFDLSGGSPSNLQIKEGVGAVLPLTNSKVTVSGLSFKNLTRPGTPGVVQISFTVARNSQSTKNEYDYQRTFTSTAALR